MEGAPDAPEKQLAVPDTLDETRSAAVTEKHVSVTDPAVEGRECTDVAEVKLAIPAPTEETKDSINAAEKQAEVPNHSEGTEGSTNAPNNGTNGRDVEEEEILPLSIFGAPRKAGLFIFFWDMRRVFKLDDLGSEILRIAVPAAMALAADPLASLVDTAFISRLGSVEVGAVGVSIAIFNQVMKVCIYPLVSVTTSFVAEEDSLISKIVQEEKDKDLENCSSVNNEMKELPSSEDSEKTVCGTSYLAARHMNLCGGRKRKYIPSVSSALIVGALLGLLQAVFLVFAAKPLIGIMGVKPGSPMLTPAMRYLTLRALGSPAVLLSLAMQGVFRGFKDTKTPLYATVVGDITNIVLDPILMFVFHMGVTGAAIAHVLSQYLITLILLCRLVAQVDVVPPSFKALRFKRFLGCGFLLLARVIAVTFCVTLAASFAARHGTTIMAAFQVCLQVWLATSLLADGLAVAGQAILASAFARGDHYKVVVATARVLQMSVVLGITLTLVVGVGLQFGSGIFSKDNNVLQIIHTGIPIVAGTQTLNSLAFVFDGINFGASDYTYSAYSMVGVAAISIPCVIYLSSTHGFIGIWISLTIYMSIRTLASVWRMAAARGPWVFLWR